MYTQHGELDGIKWLSEYKGGRTFLLHVGHLEQEYECEFEPIFGVDAADYAEMNQIMDDMHEIVKSGDTTSNYNIEQKIELIEGEKRRTNRISLHADLKNLKEKREINRQHYYASTDDTKSISSLMYQFSAGYIDYQEMIHSIGKAINPSELKANFPPDYDFLNPKSSK